MIQGNRTPDAQATHVIYNFETTTFSVRFFYLRLSLLEVNRERVHLFSIYKVV
jgi:hypothetical protein